MLETGCDPEAVDTDAGSFKKLRDNIDVPFSGATNVSIVALFDRPHRSPEP